MSKTVYLNVKPGWYKEPKGIIIAILVFGILLYLGWYVIAIILGLLLFANTLFVEKKPIEPEESLNVKQFKQLGATKEERENNILKMFDNKDRALSFSAFWKYKAKVQNPNNSRIYTEKYTTIEFKISRHISVMESKEREFLKTALLLFNDGKINSNQYEYYLLAFVYGNGKASIDNYDWSNSYEDFKDGSGVVKFYVDASDASVDSAINNFMTLLHNIKN